jgi:hypothetical protein
MEPQADDEMEVDLELVEATKQAMDLSMAGAPAATANDAVAQFKTTCGVDDTEMARNYLDAFNGDLNAAVGSYMQINEQPSNGGNPGASVIGAGFASAYNSQFGMLHPEFWTDDYDSAVRAARCQGKMLLVYLHDEHEGVHFCRMTLTREPVCETIDSNFILFACNNIEGRALGTRLTNSHGALSDLANPYLVVVNPTLPDKAVEVLQAVYSVEDLVTELKRVWGKHGSELEAQAAQFVSRETDRVAREMDRLEQNDEYEMALAQDQAREQALREKQEQERAQREAIASQAAAQAQQHELAMQRHSDVVAARRAVCACGVCICECWLGRC